MTQINESTSRSGRILVRTFIDVDFILESPLCISGDDKGTDNDVIKDSCGQPFIPGTSLAGALRAYMTLRCSEKDANFLFGSIGDEGRQSPLIVSDGSLAAPVVSFRDGVALDSEKQSIRNAKYDLEIVEYGTTGSFGLELVLRDNHGFTLKKAMDWLTGLLVALDKNDIQLGMKKGRGFGLLRVTGLKIRHFDFNKNQASSKESLAESYLRFLENNLMLKINGEGIFEQAVNTNKQLGCPKETVDSFDAEITTAERLAIEAWITAFKTAKNKFKSIYEDITFTLKLEGGLSIRQDSARPEAPDFQHIQSRGVSVVPGMSWTGALRHRMKRILQELGVDSDKSENEMRLIFGTISSKQLPGFASPTRISESRRNKAGLTPRLENTVLSTRTKINRFTGGAQDKVLFTERMSIGGKYDLVIRLRKEFTYPKDANEEAEKGTEELLKSCKGLFYLALKDLYNGFLLIGGQTAIGRGHFSYAGNGANTGFSAADEVECLNALAKRVQDLKK